MRIDLSLRKLPTTNRVQQACGLPISCIVQPFGDTDKLAVADQEAGGPTMASLLRCQSCYGFVNSYCLFNEEAEEWRCSLCGRLNDLRGTALKRYAMAAGVREALPELRSAVYEVPCSPPSARAGPWGSLEGADANGGAAATSGDAAPVVMALVDVAGCEDFVAAAREALLALVEALPSGALFGLVTFSDRVTLHDVAGGMAHSIMVLEGQPLMAPLEDVLPLASLLAPVGDCKEAIVRALEQLGPQPAAQRRRSSLGASTSAPGSGGGGVHGAATPFAADPQEMQRERADACRALGPALQGLLEYLRGVHSPTLGQPQARPGPPTWLGAPRLLTFLSGPPDLGPGRIVLPGVAVEADTEAAQVFYERAGVSAAALGACCDLYAVGGSLLGLQQMDALVNSTGGALFLYPSLEEEAMSQDVYRRFSQPLASQGLLRVRCCPELRVVACHGRAVQDPGQADLHHVVNCDPGDAFAVELQLAPGPGFDDPDAGDPTLQVAFQYSVLLQLAGAPAAGAAAAPRFAVQRRLRVATLRLGVARGPAEVFMSVGPEAVLATLVQQAVLAVREEGVGAARAGLRGWLAAFTMGFHKMCHLRVPTHELAELPIDVSFDACPPLAPLPRLAYALLRSPLLASAAHSHPDLAAYLQHLWTCVPAGELARAVYPALSAYWHPDREAAARLPLSRAALEAVQAPVLLLDAYILVLVLYRASAGPDVAYPPPTGSMLKRSIAAIRKERRVTPHVEVSREGGGGEEVLNSLLVDDPDPEDDWTGDGSGKAPGDGEEGRRPPPPTGLAAFLQQLKAQVVGQLQQEVRR